MCCVLGEFEEVSARLARALAWGQPYQPDFAHPLKRHRLIAAIEHSVANAGQSVRVG